jgi:hypothetical protein
VCYSLWYNALKMLPAGPRRETSWVHYTTSCNTRSSTPEDEQNNCPKHVELTGIINKPLTVASSWLFILFISMMHGQSNIR